MDKRRERYVQAERTTNAETKVKALRTEVADLRKQLFRAEESARIANEETTARIHAHKQSTAATRERIKGLEESVEAWKAEARRLSDELAARPKPMIDRFLDMIGRPA